MVSSLLLDPLPASWPCQPARPGGLSGLIAQAREIITTFRGEDFVQRLNRAAMQRVVCEVFQLALDEQETERRKPVEFAQAWKGRLAAMLASETIQLSGRRQPVSVADLDVDLGWSLYAAVDQERAAAIANATATPSSRREWQGSPAAFYEFWVVGGQERLGRVRYATCEGCQAGLIRKISFSLEWQYCGLGTRALDEVQVRHPGLAWYTTDQYGSALGFWERYRQSGDSPWTDRGCPCPHW
ncbi:hypothetical protein [Nonomuraea roseola]|uniref:N-acetyltransferase domain-containing protein n=1 Tax=Nonomuraea roseola TaxID=46179 RepID=A0ABV5PTA8_9ACTN